MRWKRCIISLLLLQAAAFVMADSISVSPPPESRFDKRVQRYRNHWNALIPSQFVIQNAGNMGLLSAGIGWDYGKHWETNLLFGFIPKHESTRAKLTTTLKENYIPWSINLGHRWSVQPFKASIYVNTVLGHEFWNSQPSRYPDKYYELLSTKFRLNIAVGQQITWRTPPSRRKYAKSLSLFYEFSTCDLYVRSKFKERSIALKDIIGLSIGVKVQSL